MEVITRDVLKSW